MIKQLSGAGVRSDYAYIGGFASIVLSVVSYFIARKAGTKDPNNKAQSDRWGLYVGQWAPTFFALGVALKLEEHDPS